MPIIRFAWNVIAIAAKIYVAIVIEWLVLLGAIGVTAQIAGLTGPLFAFLFALVIFIAVWDPGLRFMAKWYLYFALRLAFLQFSRRKTQLPSRPLSIQDQDLLPRALPAPAHDREA